MAQLLPVDRKRVRWGTTSSSREEQRDAADRGKPIRSAKDFIASVEPVREDQVG